MTTHTIAATDPLAAYPPAELAQNAKAARTVAEATGGRPSVLEPKLDGWRMLAHVAADGVHLYSRTGKRYDGRLPEAEAELGERFPVGTWLDGEAVAIRVEGGRTFNDWGVAQSVLSSRRTTPAMRAKVTFVVFDLLAHGGLDARSLPLANRRRLLEMAFADGGFDRIALSAQVEPTEENLQALIDAGFEGGMVKRLDARYASGQRGGGWWKLKATATIDAVIIGYEEGRNGFSGYVGAVIFGQYDADGRMVERGRCSGMTWAQRVEMSENRDAFLGRVIEVSHMGVSVGESATGRFRHPQFKRYRDDKTATQCTLHDA